MTEASPFKAAVPASQPRVSVMMAAYNTDKYLVDAVKSILTQTYRDFELIAVDDGSTDRTGALLDSLAKEDARMRVIHQANTGISPTRNLLLKESRGEYLAVMDSDDVSLPNRLQLQVDFLDAHAECVGVAGSMIFTDCYLRPIRTYMNPLEHEEIDRLHLHGLGGAFPQPCCMLRREPTLAVGGYNLEYPNAEDLDLFLKLAEVGRLGNVPEVVVLVRRHLASISHRRMAEQNERSWAAVRDAYARRKLPGAPAIDRPAAVSSESDDLLWRSWAREAAQNGNPGTARHIALELVRKHPLWAPGWGAIVDAFLGPKFTATLRRLISGKVASTSTRGA